MYMYVYSCTYTYTCMHRNEKGAAAVLLEAGADPNLQTETGLSPIAVAIHKESADVVELLANHPKIDLCLPVC
jgi:ankyrin repeat protein